MFYYKSLLGHYADSFEMNSVWLQWHGDDVTIALFFASVFSFPIVSLVSKVLKRKEHVLHFNKNYFELTRYILLILIYLVTFMPLYGASYNSFIYFKF
ncbi:hypothetical protein MKHDV_00002 [Halodesulfovibrio sp. MK-HDV]|nr:hypothetical protein MKHDV_00002 [Halodesulfovibrio sp. MK-HDV]